MEKIVAAKVARNSAANQARQVVAGILLDSTLCTVRGALYANEFRRASEDTRRNGLFTALLDGLGLQGHAGLVAGQSQGPEISDGKRVEINDQGRATRETLVR